MAMKFILAMPILALLITLSAAAAEEAQSAQSILDSDNDQYLKLKTVVNSDDSAATVFNIEEYGAVGDGKHERKLRSPRDPRHPKPNTGRDPQHG
ncbi:hypothetical protein SUGI_0122540 [Cryptomeria japonica]|uniref:polygalacturonase n=1 Tax=Cryptomeria japonica TaxID=3369 RepID=UPI002408EBB2|nr:polygalacturonase [Cryptomeria japonica]GLJ10122.1 hypothetical protein SUGI_0122540 [Cryptomeria japonica]